MKTLRIIRAFSIAGCFLALPLAHGSDVSAVKPCQEIAGLIASSGAGENPSAMSRLLKDLNCAAARNIPEDARLEFTRTKWNAALQRWEFVLRCVTRSDCVPFLVWAHAESPQVEIVHLQPDRANAESSTANTAATLVKSGQTALLTWDGGGIRVVLPVTCLDAGTLGQTVRVRLKHVDRIVRAAVVSAGALAANL
jgi:hypothetical protein